jgi:hypothetical protein
MHQVLRAAMSVGGLAALVATAAGCSNAGATQTTAARGGAETLVLTTRSGAPNPVYSVAASGVFKASGTASGIGNGKDSSLVKLPGGTFRITHPVQAEKISHQSLNKKTCVVLLRQTGTFTLSKGTGAYLGLTGYGTDHGTFTATLPRHKNGRCNTVSSAQPVAGSVHVVVTVPATILIPPRKSG